MPFVLDRKVGAFTIVTTFFSVLLFSWKFFHPPFVSTYTDNRITLHKTHLIDKCELCAGIMTKRYYRAYDFVETVDHAIDETVTLKIAGCEISYRWSYFADTTTDGDRLEIGEARASNMPLKSGEIVRETAFYLPSSGFSETQTCPLTAPNESGVVFGIKWEEMEHLLKKDTQFSATFETRTVRGQTLNYTCSDRVLEHVERYINEKDQGNHVVLLCRN